MSADLAIVTPVRGRPDALRGCAASVDRQRSEGSVEHIIVDGGVARRAPARRESPGRLWLQEPDDSLYEALNRGIAASSAPVIGQLNADEQSLPGTFNRVLDIMARAPSVDLVFGDYILVDAAGRPLAARREIPARQVWLRHGVNSILSCATFFRRSLWERTGPFDASLRLLGDKDWYLRALDAGGRFRHVGRYLALFTLGSHNVSRDDGLARREQAEVRQRHGGTGAGWRRLLVSVARRSEKALHGAYFPHRVHYPYCCPDGREIWISGWTRNRWPREMD